MCWEEFELASLINNILDAIFHMTYLAGLCMLSYRISEKSLSSIGKQFDRKIKFRMSVLGEKLEKKKNRSWIYRHIDELLYLAKPDYTPGASFLRFSVQFFLIFFVVFLGMLLVFGGASLRFGNPFTGISVESSTRLQWEFPFLVAGMAAFSFYLKLRLNYANQKIKGSYDLLEVVKILPKFASYSMDTALSKTCELLSNDNVLRRPLSLLALSFANYASKSELIRDVQRFSSAIGTTFSVELSSILLYALEYGTGWLTSSLSELHRSMEKQREIVLEARQNSRDAILLGRYVNLILIAIVLGSVALSIGWEAYIKLQFFSPLGLSLLSILLILLFISFILGTYLSKPVLDYH